jgi:hypothetical protein
LDLKAQFFFLLLVLLLFLLAISYGHVVQNFTLGCLPGGCGATPMTTTTNKRRRRRSVYSLNSPLIGHLCSDIDEL